MQLIKLPKLLFYIVDMKDRKMTNAVGYVRVSLKKMVRDGQSLDAQKDKIFSYCNLHGLNLVQIIEDAGISGKFTDNRAGFRGVMEKVSKKEVGHVVCYSLSRWGRDIVDTMTSIKTMERMGIAFHSVMESIDTKTPMGRFFLSVLTALSALEREQLGERTSEVLQFKKRNGVVYSPTPFGFERIGNQLRINKYENKVIQKMKRLRNSGLSYQKIADWLNDHGYKSKNGKIFYGATIRYILMNSQATKTERTISL